MLLAELGGDAIVQWSAAASFASRGDAAPQLLEPVLDDLQLRSGLLALRCFEHQKSFPVGRDIPFGAIEPAWRHNVHLEQRSRLTHPKRGGGLEIYCHNPVLRILIEQFPPALRPSR